MLYTSVNYYYLNFPYHKYLYLFELHCYLAKTFSHTLGTLHSVYSISNLEYISGPHSLTHTEINVKELHEVV